MKRLMIVLMCIWGISSLSGCMKQNVVNVEANFSACSDWQTAYIEKLGECNTENQNAGEGIYHSYILYDIDQNTIPELILQLGTKGEERELECYTVQDGEMILLDHFEGQYASFYPCPEEKALFIREICDGAIPLHGALTKLTIENGEMVRESILENVEDSEVLSFLESRNLLDNFIYDHTGVQTVLPILEYDTERIDEILVQDTMTEEEARVAIEAVLNNEEKAYLVYGDTQTSVVPEYKNIGMGTLEELLRCDSAIENLPDIWQEGVIRRLTWIDMNGDGREECILDVYNEDASRVWVVMLSAQDEMVYAYVIRVMITASEYGTHYYDDGVIGLMVETGSHGPDKTYAYYVLRFYKDQIYYKVYKGDVNGTIVEWETAPDLYE
ncbi:MAG: hypothetical protein K2N24_07460 [Lachnospiraceae bacterium]|nr:hypothetical protein [Lachnospiraceae bacterium]